MTFEELLARLRNEVAHRIKNGHLTERRLARMTRLSQPHVHHILNGKRGMTPEVADRFLEVLGMGAGELLDNPGTANGGILARRQERCILLPLLEGFVGPEDAAPQMRGCGLYFPFPENLLGTGAVAEPKGGKAGFAVVRLGHDELLQQLTGRNDLLVLSMQPTPEEDHAWLDLQHESAVWAYRGSWIFQPGLHVTEASASERFPWMDRGLQLRAEGKPVARVQWWLRRFGATSLGAEWFQPDRGEHP